MTTEEAVKYLKEQFDPEYHRYIETKLAGDFAWAVADRFKRLSEWKSCALYMDYKKSCQALKDHEAMLKKQTP